MSASHGDDLCLPGEKVVDSISTAAEQLKCSKLLYIHVKSGWLSHLPLNGSTHKVILYLQLFEYLLYVSIASL